MTSGIAAIVPDDRTPEVYVSEVDIPGVREGMTVDITIVPPADPNGICRVLGNQSHGSPKPLKMSSFSGLVRQMAKTRDRLKATLEELSDDDSEQVDRIREKLDFLAKGISLFS